MEPKEIFMKKKDDDTFSISLPNGLVLESEDLFYCVGKLIRYDLTEELAYLLFSLADALCAPAQTGLPRIITQVIDEVCSSVFEEGVYLNATSDERKAIASAINGLIEGFSCPKGSGEQRNYDYKVIVSDLINSTKGIRRGNLYVVLDYVNKCKRSDTVKSMNRDRKLAEQLLECQTTKEAEGVKYIELHDPQLLLSYKKRIYDKGNGCPDSRYIFFVQITTIIIQSLDTEKSEHESHESHESHELHGSYSGEKKDTFSAMKAKLNKNMVKKYKTKTRDL